MRPQVPKYPLLWHDVQPAVRDIFLVFTNIPSTALLVREELKAVDRLELPGVHTCPWRGYDVGTQKDAASGSYADLSSPMLGKPQTQGHAREGVLRRRKVRKSLFYGKERKRVSSEISLLQGSNMKELFC